MLFYFGITSAVPVYLYARVSKNYVLYYMSVGFTDNYIVKYRQYHFIVFFVGT